jgi:hypothetical protein
MRPFVLSLLLASSAAAWAVPAGAPPDLERIEAVRAREAELMERVRAFDPRKHEELVALKATDPRSYLRALVRVAAMVDGPTDPPELVPLRDALTALHAAHPDPTQLDADARRALATEVYALAEKVFDVKQTERRRRIGELKQTIAALEADVERRDREREVLLQRFVEQFLLGRVEL